MQQLLPKGLLMHGSLLKAVKRFKKNTGSGIMMIINGKYYLPVKIVIWLKYRLSQSRQDLPTTETYHISYFYKL
jgi:hypothetical protein